MTLLVAAVEVLGWSTLAGTVLGFSSALVSSFLLNRSWTFKSDRSYLGSAWRYVAVSLLGLGLNVGLMLLLIKTFGVWYFTAQMAVIVVVPVVNYLLNGYWTFKEFGR